MQPLPVGTEVWDACYRTGETYFCHILYFCCATLLLSSFYLYLPSAQLLAVQNILLLLLRAGYL